jgi:hypothetical protein
MFRAKFHEKSVQFNQDARSRDITVIQGNRSLVRNKVVKNCKDDSKLMWVPVKRVEPNCVRSPEDLDATHGFKVGDHRSAEAYVNNVKAAALMELVLVQFKESLIVQKGNVQTIRLMHLIVQVKVKSLNRLLGITIWSCNASIWEHMRIYLQWVML